MHGKSVPQQRQSNKQRETVLKLEDRKKMSLAIADKLMRIGEEGEGFRGLYVRRAERMRGCGTWMELGVMADGGATVLRANWCRDRLCPMCAWRRSRRNAIALQEAVDLCRTSSPGLRWVLITLTIKNVVADDLSHALDIMLRAWNLMSKRREWKKCFIGMARNVEITFNKKTRTYHPHIHVLLQCAEGYYMGNYLTNNRLERYWLESLGGEYSENRAFCSIGAADTEGGMKRGVKEVSKYITKTVPILEAETEDVEGLAEAIHGRRMVAYTGSVRKAMQALGIDAEAESMDDVALHREQPIERIILRWSQAGSAYYIDHSIESDDMDE